MMRTCLALPFPAIAIVTALILVSLILSLKAAGQAESSSPAGGVAAVDSAPAGAGAAGIEELPGGLFYRSHWFERGLENGNPTYDRRFRVNAPETVLHSSFGGRSEARASGCMLIRAEEDPRLLEGAELYLELWGGHPQTAGKRLTVNGRSTHAIAEIGTEAGHCTHQYPVIQLAPTDLVNGYNAVQFACDKGKSFWGHFIVDNACLRTILKADHPDLAAAGLKDFAATVKAAPAGDESEALELAIDVPEAHRGRIAAVEYQGYYLGFDENGDGRARDWHGYTLNRRPAAHVGMVEAAPWTAKWALSMLPPQEEMAVRAVIHFSEPAGLSYRTAATAVKDPRKEAKRVSMHTSADLPRPFVSRVNREKRCTIELPIDPAEIERAELHVVIWDGGAGKTAEPFTLNGRPLAVAGKGLHDVIYRVIELEPGMLKKGANEVRLLCDTEHHGIEVLLPGPVLMVRRK